MCWDCEFPGCTSKTVTKVVNGVIMIKSIQPIHSPECLEAQAVRKLSKSEKEGNPDENKILISENGLAKEHGFLEWPGFDSNDSSSEGDDDSESDSSEKWPTDDDETDDPTENNGEDFN